MNLRLNSNCKWTRFKRSECDVARKNKNKATEKIFKGIDHNRSSSRGRATVAVGQGVRPTLRRCIKLININKGAYL
jgi:hypothetical protein